jgi:hypothetical protein
MSAKEILQGKLPDNEHWAGFVFHFRTRRHKWWHRLQCRRYPVPVSCYPFWFEEKDTCFQLTLDKQKRFQIAQNEVWPLHEHDANAAIQPETYSSIAVVLLRCSQAQARTLGAYLRKQKDADGFYHEVLCEWCMGSLIDDKPQTLATLLKPAYEVGSDDDEEQPLPVKDTQPILDGEPRWTPSELVATVALAFGLFNNRKVHPVSTTTVDELVEWLCEAHDTHREGKASGETTRFQNGEGVLVLDPIPENV